MTIKDFFNTYDEKTAKLLLCSRLPNIFLLKESVDVKKDISELTYAQFVAASMLLEREITCYDLIRSLVLIIPITWSRSPW